MKYGELQENFKVTIYQIKIDLYALYLANKDPRVSWGAQLFIAALVGYGLSPIDLIPDFIPVVGYVDDFVLIPLGVFLVRMMIPESVMIECRIKAEEHFTQTGK